MKSSQKRCPWAVQMLKDLVSIFMPEIIFIMEAKVDRRKIEIMQRQIRYDGMFFVNGVHNCDETDFTVRIVSQNIATTSNFVEFRDSRNFMFSRHRVSVTVKRLVKDM